MFKLFKSRPSLNWIEIQSEEDLEKVLASAEKVAIFKHSTRCPVSSMAQNRIETSWEEDTNQTPIYLLDLIRYRDLSNKIASKLGVGHQSPQLILVQNGKAFYDSSHHMIQSKEAAKYI